MPKKIRELKQILLKVGFICRTGKGSHTKWYHILLSQPLILSGKDSSDAKLYQEKDVDKALKIIAKIQKNEENNNEK